MKILHFIEWGIFLIGRNCKKYFLSQELQTVKFQTLEFLLNIYLILRESSEIMFRIIPNSRLPELNILKNTLFNFFVIWSEFFYCFSSNLPNFILILVIRVVFSFRVLNNLLTIFYVFFYWTSDDHSFSFLASQLKTEINNNK